MRYICRKILSQLLLLLQGICEIIEGLADLIDFRLCSGRQRNPFCQIPFSHLHCYSLDARERPAEPLGHISAVQIRSAQHQQQRTP
ncbi:hypothetical protein D3C81_1745180 [compost metagenome]